MLVLIPASALVTSHIGYNAFLPHLSSIRMRTSHLFAFGSNPFGKACPGVTEIIVQNPVDILPALVEGKEEDIDGIEAIQGAWDKTLIKLRQSYKQQNQEDTAAVPLSADDVEEFMSVGIVRGLLQEAGLHRPSSPTILESGSICAIAPEDNRQGQARVGCIWSETLAGLAADARSYWKPLPGPPGTTYTVATGLSHAVLLSTGKSGLDQVLGIGDNRYGAALPKSTECRHPPSHLSEPVPIESLCGIAIAGISAGGSRSAAWSHEGEAWIWGQGLDGVELVQIPPSQSRSGGSEKRAEDADFDIASIALGDKYEFVLTTSGSVWVRGDSQSFSIL
ncbi:hypothetical protein QFC21_001978 [Naganishia friedmannii]|uniref:Uncharacterized protein n=1 Tax=Naganishia friedmannii TaxID=89922 RepID=A0ACC2VYS6_9TREE|nr:hypothetical protein QFC21_001978 [Naganishia friedmannii]